MMSLAKRDERLEKQRLRQRGLRERDRRLKRPTRDDFARMLLHIALAENIQQKHFAELDRLQDGLVKNLAEQGFNKDQCDLVFEDLIERYKRGWSFERKVRLLTPAED